MSVRRRRRPYSGSKVVQRYIPSRFERVTQERIDRNRRGRALCEAMIRSHRETTRTADP
jgi:hypothetical protein